MTGSRREGLNGAGFTTEEAQRFRVTPRRLKVTGSRREGLNGAGFTTGEIQRGRTLRPKRLNETRVTAEEAQRDQIHDRRTQRGRVNGRGSA